MQEIQRFNHKNPGRRITPLNVLRSARNCQKRIDQAGAGCTCRRTDAMRWRRGGLRLRSEAPQLEGCFNC